MEDFYFEEKKIIDGRVYPFNSHMQVFGEMPYEVVAHMHEAIEILFCLGGVFEIFLDGKRNVLEEGGMIIINSKEVHKIISNMGSGNSYLVVKFDPDMLYTTTQNVFEAKYVLPFTLNYSTHQKVFTKEEIQDTYLPSLIKEIYNEFQNKNYGFELAIKSHICKLFLWVLRVWNENNIDLNIEYNLRTDVINRLQIVFDYVDQNYATNINVSVVAKLCNTSYSYFSRFFKSVMKKNFSEYVTFVRISKAESLLIETDLNITEISSKVGFSTSSYFIQKFKLYKNMPPKRYRKLFSNVM